MSTKRPFFLDKADILDLLKRVSDLVAAGHVISVASVTDDHPAKTITLHLEVSWSRLVYLGHEYRLIEDPLAPGKRA